MQEYLLCIDPERGQRRATFISAEVGGQPTGERQVYTIATNNFVALGEDYECLRDIPELNQYGACDEAIIRFVKLGQDAWTMQLRQCG